MKIQSLERYIPNQSKALEYLQYNLEGLNALSIAICSHVKFEDGEFYTYLSKNLTEDQLHGFRCGGIAGRARFEIEKMVFQELSSDKGVFCILDSFEETYDPDANDPLFDKAGVHYKNEVYYVVSSAECSFELLEKCFKESYIIWHALCVLSRVNFSIHSDRSITESEIIDFVKGAEMILLGAYDGEGYVCWKKNSSL